MGSPRIASKENPMQQWRASEAKNWKKKKIFQNQSTYQRKKDELQEAVWILSLF